MRTAESFKQFFDLLTILHPQYNVEPPVLPRRAPRCVEIGDGYHADSIEDYFCVQYFEAVDLAVTGIKDRFYQPGYATYSSLESQSSKTKGIIQLNWNRLFLYIEMT